MAAVPAVATAAPKGFLEKRGFEIALVILCGVLIGVVAGTLNLAAIAVPIVILAGFVVIAYPDWSFYLLMFSMVFEPLGGSASPPRLMAAVFFASYGLKVVFQRIPLRGGITMWPILMLISDMLISATWCKHLPEWQSAFIGTVSGMIVYFFSLNVLFSYEDLVRAIRGFALSICPYGAVCSYVYMGVDMANSEDHHALDIYFFDTNFFSCWILMAGAVQLFSPWWERSKGWVVVHLISFGFGAFALLTLNSRQGLVGFGVLMVFFTVLKWKYYAVKVFFIVVAVAAGIVIPISYQRRLAEQDPAALAAGTGDSSTKLHHDLAAWGVQMFKDNPVIGVGFGSFMETTRFYDKNRTSNLRLVAHNMWVETGAELGVVGLTLVASCIGFGYYELVRVSKIGKLLKKEGWTDLALGFGFGLFVYAFNANFISSISIAFFWLCLGLISTWHNFARRELEALGQESG